MWSSLLSHLLLTNPILSILAQDTQQAIKTTPEPFNVAIVGAGAAGSSTAYHLAKFAKDSDLERPINITIFEAESRIGGRCTTINALDDSRYPVELGASIFVKINEILYNFTNENGLLTSTREGDGTEADFDLGVWDGTEFVFTISNESAGLKGTLDGWWDIAKIVWRYGLSAFRMRSIRDIVIGRFLNMYNEKFPFQDLTDVAREVDLLSVTSQTGSELLRAAGVGERFSRELIQASSRVNYAQNLQHFHGLETMVCMSTDGGMSVEGGNWQIFDGMVKRSGAHVELGTKVFEVETTVDGRSTVTYSNGEDETLTEAGFDAVVLAAPFPFSNITMSPAPAWKPGRAEYVQLHVTHLASPFRVDPHFFGLGDDQAHLVPDTVLTTLPPNSKPDRMGRGTLGVGPTTFWSFSTLRVVSPLTDTYIPGSVQSGHIPAENLEPINVTTPDWPGRAANNKQYIYKVFSPAPITAEHLIDLFGWCNHSTLQEELQRTDCTLPTPRERHSNNYPKHHISSLPKELLTWNNEKVWNSYPYMPPTTDFECFDVYDCKDYVAPSEGAWKGKLYYTSPMEQFISAMEAMALSGRNIAKLIVEGLDGRQLPPMTKDEKQKQAGHKF